MYENSCEYLERTRAAVASLIKVTETFREPLYREDPPVIVGHYRGASDRDERIREWQGKNAARIARWHEIERQYFDNAFSLAAVCGALLQIAYSAISAYCEPVDLPDNLALPLRTGSKPSQFYRGREVNGLPLGLVVFAGRNQAAHVDEGMPANKLVREVFSAIASGGPSLSGGESWDPAFDLRNTRVKHYAHNVVALIGWTSIDAYEQDMRSMLGLT